MRMSALMELQIQRGFWVRVLHDLQQQVIFSHNDDDLTWDTPPENRCRSKWSLILFLFPSHHMQVLVRTNQSK